MGGDDADDRTVYAGPSLQVTTAYLEGHFQRASGGSIIRAEAPHDTVLQYMTQLNIED